MVKMLKSILTAVFNLLPESPFQVMIDSVIFDEDFIPFLNWYVPFDTCAAVTLSWLVCLVAYYGYAVIKKILSKYVINILLEFGGKLAGGLKGIEL